MRRFLLFGLGLILSCSAFAQDFSNKGKEFYLCFPQHVPSGTLASLSVWITSDKASTGTVSMMNGSFSTSFDIPANGLKEIAVPFALGHISNGESSNGTTNTILKKAIRVKVDQGKPPVVAYVQQFGNARSAATLLLPTNVLGKKYYAVSFNQNGGGNVTLGGNTYMPRSQFQIIATKDNTSVTITPVKNGVTGTPFTVTFPLAGDMIQYQSNDAAAASQDLTGTLIESTSLGLASCSPIAVFSGSSNLTMGTASPVCNGGSYDPLFQQLYPVSTWGKNFGFVPFANYPNGVPYRVMASDNNTNVYFNGVLVANLNAGQIYPAAFTANPVTLTGPTSITADKPICVTEYMQSSGCAGNGGGSNQGDPDMVVLNPIEQNISDITIFSTKQQVIRTQWVNILMPTAGTGSFKVGRNGCVPSAPGGTWNTFAALPGYSFMKLQLTTPGTGTCQGTSTISDSYRMLADSGFNAIAYGLGDNETYAYSAGTNVKDLYQQIGVHTQYGIETSPAVCTNTPFQFKVSLPYCADSMIWDISGLPGPPANPPTQVYTTCTPGPGGPDSTTIVNGKTIYWYSLPTFYNISTIGSYPVNILAYAPNADGCGNEQSIDFDLAVSDPPIADFSYVIPGCYADSVSFAETTPQSPKPTYHYWWDFGDPGSGANNTATIKNPKHLYSTPGTYTVRFSDITTPGCLSDTISHTFTLAPLPDATITGTTTVCINAPSPSVTFTGTGGTAEYIFSYTIDNGGGPGPVQTVTSVGGSATVPVPTLTAGTYTYSLVGVRNQNPAVTNCTKAISGQTAVITVNPDATITLSSAAGTSNQTVCVNTPITDITYAVGGSGTGASITAGSLPAGVTGSFAGGVFTISGTPTVSGTFNYTVGTTGPCVNPSSSGTITVSPNSTIALTSAPGTDAQTVCINSPIANINYVIGGSGTGASITAGALPAGVTGSFAGGTFTISGTPTVSGTFNYTVTTTGPCVNNSASGTITVNANSTLALSSAAGTDNQTLCVNSPITNITYALGGGATGASITAGALPAGVTGSFAGGVFTISGTPTVSGVFNYTVGATGPCNNPTLNGTITVNANATITLTSGAGSASQTVCINTAIANITYAIGGGGTGASITAGALPAGVTGSYSGGVFSITGTPTVSGTFNYTVTTTGTCVNNSLSGTITVNDNSTLSLTSAAGTNTQTVCVNTPITNITYGIGGGGTGASITAGSLPAGVTGSYAGGVFTITGTPSVSGTFNYTVQTTGPCTNPSLSGTITVTANSSILLTSGPGTDNQTACINNPITSITYQIAGGGTGASITAGALPAGVAGSYAGGVFTISGTPTVNGTFNYTVTTTGPCVNNSMSGTITINGNSSLTLTSAAGSNNQTVCINNAITNITYAAGGGATGASITAGSLPPGVTGSFAGGVFTITGTPTSAGVYNYTVTTTGPCVNPSLSGTITVNNNSTITLTSGPGSNTQTVCVNNPITNITYNIGGGGTGASITAGALPAGVTGSFAGGVFTISGSPTATGVFNYTVTTTGPCVNNSLSGTITVNANSTLTLTSAAGSNVQTVCINNAITNITYAIGGGGTGASITAGSLPAGVTGTFAGGVFTISGTPTSAGVYNYTVTTAGPCNNPSLSGTITVNDNSTITLSSGAGSNTQTVCINTPITNITYSIGGGGTGASITAGSLPAGVTGSYAGGVFTISGTPTANGVFNYTVTTTGPCINNSLSGTITVNGNSTLTLTSAAGSNIQTVCVNNAINNITYSVSGTGSGASITAGALPAGVTGTFAGGVFTISGTPTASGVFNYTVTTTGPCNNPSLSGTITVNANSTITLSSAPGSDAQTVCINNAINNIVYIIGGGGTGASITAGSLPAGVTGSFAGGVFTITGTPSVSGVFNYTVTTTGPCINNSMSGSITVNGNSTMTLTSGVGSDNQTVCINNSIANITYSIGGTGTGATVTGLPVGVNGSFAGGTFTISGTPTVAGTFPFTVNSTGPCGNATANGMIIVNDNSTIALTSAPGSNIQEICFSNAITDITYAIGGGGTGASIVAGALPAGVTGTYSGGVFTITGTPSVTGTYNYTVRTTGPCVNNQLSGTITINPLPTATMTGNAEVCQNAPDQLVTFTGANGTRPYTFTYTVDNGSGPGPQQTISTVGANNSVTLPQSAAAFGTFIYTLIKVSDGTATACEQNQAATVTIKVNEVPTATITGDKRVCINSTPPDVTFTGTGGALPYTFTYTVDMGAGPGPQQTISTTGSNTSVTLPASTTSAGTHTYHLISVKDGSPAGCSQPQPADVVIRVSDVFPNPDFSFNDPVCLPNAKVDFQNLSNISDGSPMTYAWTFGDGGTSSGFQPSHTYTAVGPFNVTLQATSDAGCVSQKTVAMNNIHPQPKANFSTDRPDLCILGSVVFTDNSDPKDGTTTAWNWDLGDGNTQNSPTFSHTYFAADTFNVKLYITNSFGCNSDTISKPFPVYDYPSVNAGPDKYVLEGGIVVLTPTVTGQNLQYLWTPNLYMNDNTKENPKVIDPKTDITYTLTVTGIGGCPKSDQVFVKLLKFPRIPNTFTPNGDGINDTWKIEHLDSYPDNYVQVFTRTGQKVYESRGSKIEWDGMLKGKPLPVDTYYYIIEPGNGRDPITGYVTIMK